MKDKLGTAYEPYIFAALNSAKVMVVVGTKPEYFNAVWVRNEWSRYLMLMQEHKEKTLIPAYKDMDPYDLPDALSMFQAQDMSKLGFMQDLIRSIRKIVQADAPKVVEKAVVRTENAAVSPLLKRAFLLLEDGDWSSADEYCEKVLDQNPENARGYLSKLMAELQLRKKEDFQSHVGEIKGYENFKKVQRFGDDALKTKLENYDKQGIYNETVQKMQQAKIAEEYRSAKAIFESLGDFADAAEKAEACENSALECLYNLVIKAMAMANSEEDFKAAATQFQKLDSYKDAKEQAKNCLAFAEEKRKGEIYNYAIRLKREDTIKDLEKAIRLFESIARFRDVNYEIERCKNWIEEIKAEEKQKEE
ncbi:MAG: toll/interleukin-1 receptor domain-containing protein [Ruminococcus sp.]|nr:toll/interleukin-1 receptor domain-containing protein [Ruminococcus sp.]